MLSHVRVADSGSGIEPEVLKTLFEDLPGDNAMRASGRFRWQPATKPDGRAPALFPPWGGGIAAESLVGVGSTFTITMAGDGRSGPSRSGWLRNRTRVAVGSPCRSSEKETEAPGTLRRFACSAAGLRGSVRQSTVSVPSAFLTHRLLDGRPGDLPSHPGAGGRDGHRGYRLGRRKPLPHA